MSDPAVEQRTEAPPSATESETALISEQTVQIPIVNVNTSSSSATTISHTLSPDAASAFNSSSLPPTEQCEPSSTASVPPSSAASTLAAPASQQTTTTPSPGKRRPKPPTKGILKPPPPPAKPTFGNRLRDMVVGSVNAVGERTRLFETEDPSSSTSVAGPSVSTSPPKTGIHSTNAATTNPNTVPPVGTGGGGGGGTLASISGRLAGLGLGRFVSAATSAAGVISPQSTSSTPSNSPLPRTIGLPDVGMVSPTPSTVSLPIMSEKSRQKQPLKRATFVLPSLSITYPISSQGEPWSVKVTEDRKRIESTHRTLLSTTTGPQYWTSQRLVTLYESACKGREERPRVGIVRALEVLPAPPKPRHIHLILRIVDHTTIGQSPPAGVNTLDTPFNRHSAESFADVLLTEWGLSDLKLEQGVIESEDALKPILHALLISGTLPVLSLAGNKKIKVGGWRLLAVFLKRARSLRYIDLSDTIWDKKGIEYLVQALNCTTVRPSPESTAASPDLSKNGDSPSKSTKGPPIETGDEKEDNPHGGYVRPAPLLREAEGIDLPSAVQTLRMDGCGLKANVLETLTQGIRSSDLKNVSLRRNKIGPLGGVAVALLMRDYPDGALSMTSFSPSINTTASISSPLTTTQEIASSPSVPYAARIRRNNVSAAAAAQNTADEKDLPPIPLVVSSPAGGITTRTVPEGYKPPPPPKHPLVMPGGGNSAMQDAGNFPVSQAVAEGRLSTPEMGGASIALQRSVRALDGVERIGRLLTLDLKSNEIRNGVSYIAQVLKRNRTLKVLNLSDNRIEPSGLAALADALKYNSSLETLDLSSNPCCGPSQEGITALRTAFTLNTSLKRLFLSDTGLTTDGAIALAEFLPESKSLLHLDLTLNSAIDTAGILAISVGLRSNQLIRCLDVSIPPNVPELADISQNILQSCIRNTELAAKDGGAAIWGPIKRSTLVRQVKEADEARAEKERENLAKSPEGVAREFVYQLKPERVLLVSEETARDLQKWYLAGETLLQSTRHHAWEPGQLPSIDFKPLYERAKALRERIVDQIQESTDGDKLEKLLSVNDLLSSQIDNGVKFNPPPRLLLPSQIVPIENQTPIRPQQSRINSITPNQSPLNNNNHQQQQQQRFVPRRHMRIASTEISSPNFSIGDSDNDSDAEELQLDPNLGSSQRVKSTGLGLGIRAISTSSTSNTNSIGDVGPSPTKGVDGGGSSTQIGEEIEEGEPSTPDQDERGGMRIESLTSPVERVSRAWVEEEGEIFRKGTKLGVADEDEVEENEQVSGEELRKEILETPVARSPTRRVIHLDQEGEDGADEREV